MRIAILAHQLRVAGGLSVGRNVIAALRRVADEHEYFLIMPTGVGYEELQLPTRVTSFFYKRSGFLGQAWFDWSRLPSLVHEYRPDLIWGLGNSGLRRPGAKQAILFHKPHFIYESKYNCRETRRLRLNNELARQRLISALPATQIVFCQTRTAAGRFHRFFDFKGQIEVMPNAVSRFATDGASRERPKALELAKGKFTLFCLTKFYAHKNLEIFLDLFEHHRDSLGDVAVVFTIEANQHPKAPAFVQALQRPHLRPHLINVGPVSQRELASYYAATDGLILPTLLESFSGTYLEAMQFERPIITSDMDFAREVCGDAAEYFDPFDVESIRDAILRVKNSSEKRAALVAAGAEQLRDYVRDWDSIVRDAIGKLENVVSTVSANDRQLGIAKTRRGAS